jgi:hypothetical protein
MGTELERRFALARAEVAKRLSSLYKTWTVMGDTVAGPGTLAIRVEDQHKLGPTHFDVGFVLNRDRSDIPVLWDCVAGLGRTDEEIVAWAIESWANSTVPAIIELLVQNGAFATHLGYDDPQGCAGWHVIHGPVTGFGKGDAPKNLQSWLLETPLLPSLGPMVAGAFPRPLLNGVKLLFGYAQDEVAEVRINGVAHEPASRRLRFMKWPRAKDAAFVRCYWLFVHNRESGLPPLGS